jgi:hypothetical protein
MQNTVWVSCVVEVTDKVVFRWRKTMKPRNLAESGEGVVCFLN